MENRIDPKKVPSPCFLIDKSALLTNLETLSRIKKQCRIDILMAQKAFATFPLYNTISKYLDGVCASGHYEALLGLEFGKQIHTYSPAYRDDEIEEICQISDHIIFNSPEQFLHFEKIVQKYQVSAGLRVNPECSLVKTPLYDPCSANSRLGTRKKDFFKKLPDTLEGLHFHVLCEEDSYKLEIALQSFEEKFAEFLPKIKWVNMGGGHDLTRKHYNIEHFISLIGNFKKKYPHLQIYIEPGGAVVYNTGYLLCTVLDILPGKNPNAILDISCTCHTPDILEMPYRASIQNEIPIANAPYVYQLGGNSCLAGDVFGAYGFLEPLKKGQLLIFEDMAHYTMVKTTMFNGIKHPSVAIFDPSLDEYTIIKTFSYNDYKNRLS